MKLRKKKEMEDQLKKQSGILFDTQKNKALAEHNGDTINANIQNSIVADAASKVTALRWALGISNDI